LHLVARKRESSIYACSPGKECARSIGYYK
jgi:hypothetical protein